jgi:hypothetical protein
MTIDEHRLRVKKWRLNLDGSYRRFKLNPNPENLESILNDASQLIFEAQQLKESKNQTPPVAELKSVPNPGSSDALDQGCLCPVMDNCYGAGAQGTNGKPQDEKVFWQAANCPLHGKKTAFDNQKKGK